MIQIRTSGYLIEALLFGGGCIVLLLALTFKRITSYFQEKTTLHEPVIGCQRNTPERHIAQSTNHDKYHPREHRDHNLVIKKTPTKKCSFQGYVCSSNPELLGSPEKWSKFYRAAGGPRQSPVNIVSSKVHIIAAESQRTLSFNKQYFKQPTSMTLLNDGHSVLLGACFGNEFPTIIGGPLNRRYRFKLAQFKWGPTSREGSEHTINSKRFAMEMQLMHIHGDVEYLNVEEAVRQKAVVFISFLFEISRQDNPFLAPLIDHLCNVTIPNTKYLLDPFPLCWLFQPFKAKYYCYDGSLTCPPCSEGVKWLIQPEPLGISNRQLNAFRELRGFTGPLLQNARPVQKLNNRTISFYI